MHCMLRVRIAAELRTRAPQFNFRDCVACTELLPVLLLLSQLFQAAVLSHSTFPKQTANRVVVDRYSLMFAYFNSCVHLRAMPCVSWHKVGVTNRLCATSTAVVCVLSYPSCYTDVGFDLLFHAISEAVGSPLLACVYVCSKAWRSRECATPASSHVLPCSGEALTLLAYHACGCPVIFVHAFGSYHTETLATLVRWHHVMVSTVLISLQTDWLVG